MNSDPSDKAIEAANAAYYDSPKTTPRHILEAAHDPSLGLERSVRLGDVVEAVRAREDDQEPPTPWSDFIAREFGSLVDRKEER